MPRYCPNCSAELRPPEANCWNCGALFGADSGWAPTNDPTGRFKEYKKEGGAVKDSVQRPAASKVRLLNVLRALYCVALSIIFVFAGGVALMFTLGTGFYWIAALAMLLYGFSNLFLTLLAFTASDRRVVRVSATTSFIAGVALLAGVSAGISGEALVSIAAWWAGLLFNWLAIKTIFDSRITFNATAED